MEKLEKNINITIDYYKYMIEDENKYMIEYYERLKDYAGKIDTNKNGCGIHIPTIKEYIKQIESAQDNINKYTMIINELYRIQK